MSIVDWIYPRFCVGCGREGQYICNDCRSRIVRVDGSLRYTGLVRTILKDIKYRGAYDMVHELVDIWSPRLSDLYAGCIITSVPMWQRKQKIRGYNQAEMIAQDLAMRWDLPYRQLLVRTRQTEPMYGLTRLERAENIRGAFTAIPGAPLPAFAIVVDDVWTTGSTLRECTDVLMRAGVSRVTPLTLAR